VYQYCQLSFEELTALYTASDIALITPMRDGMNLIAKEFVASRKDRKGVLILSEMTGAAHELNEAIIINPNDANEIASKLHIALTMDENEQERRMTRMQERISSYTVKDWAEDFFRELAATRHKQLKYSTSFLDFALKSYIRGKLVKSRKRLFLLDYDGTLRNYENNPGNALPTPEITELLHQLTLNDLNDVYLVSGRRMSELEKWFGHIKELKLVSEHAGLLKIADNQFCQLVEDQALDWMQEVRHIMQGVCERCPSSNLEEKDFSLVWHYRNVSSELGEYRSKELINALQELTLTYNLKVHKGKKTVEIRPADINKAVIINKLFNEYSYDFVLAIGDDNTDEDMFRILSGLNHYTVKVGVEPSFAKYHLLNPSQVLSFLRGLYYQEEGQALISA
jgi:trehalose 6-phosphate synthase/phosphatase